MGSLSAKNESEKISRLGTFNVVFTGHFVWGGEAILKVLDLVRNRV
jgi:hypothetical protein